MEKLEVNAEQQVALEQAKTKAETQNDNKEERLQEHSEDKQKCSLTKIIIINILITLVVATSINLTSSWIIFKEQLTSKTQTNQQQQLSKVQAQAPVTQTSPTNSTVQSPPDLNILTEGWIYFDKPKWLYEFTYNTSEEVVIPFGSIIPNTTKPRFMHFVVLTRSQTQFWGDTWTKIRFINGKKQFQKWIVTRDTLAYQMHTAELIAPIQQARELRIQGFLPQKNKIFTTLYVDAIKE